MTSNAVRLLDILDKLRELPPHERAKEIQAYPPDQQAWLNNCLASDDGSPDPFETPVAVDIAGSNGSPPEDSNATVDEPPGEQASSAKSAPRPTVKSPTKYKAGDVLLKQFRIVEHIADGGMGHVFRAVDENTDERVALKFLPFDRIDSNSLRLLKSELRTAHRVRSPYVCAVHALHIDQSQDPAKTGMIPPFITMQFIEGEDLSRLIKRLGRLAGPKVLGIAYELAKGMAAIHEVGILHRDLKPSNVMLDQHGIVQILDFGIASIASDDDAVVGFTPDYIAPEIEARRRPTVSSDIYCYGLVLFELVTGQNAVQLIRNGTQPRAVLDELKDQVHEGLRDVIVRALEPNPADRFEDMERIIGVLPRAPVVAPRRSESMSAIAQSTSIAALRPWAVGVLVAAIVAIAVAIAFQERALPSTSVAGSQSSMSPEILFETARGYMKKLMPEADGAEASGWCVRPGPDSTIAFWYRSHKGSLEPMNALRGVTLFDPAPSLDVSTVGLDLNGHLVEMYRAPANRAPSPALSLDVTTVGLHPNGHPVDKDDMPRGTDEATQTLKQMLEGAFDQEIDLKPQNDANSSSRPGWIAPIPTSGVQWYALTFHRHPRELQLAAIGTQIVYLGAADQQLPRLSTGSAPVKLVPIKPGSVPELVSAIDRKTFDLRSELQTLIPPESAIWWLYAVPVLSLLPALRNVRARQCDTRTAFRISTGVFLLSLLGWLLSTRPGLLGSGVFDRWAAGVGAAIFYAAAAWVCYAAVDPYVRLTWKRCMIGFARLTTEGTGALLRDSVVGRNLLFGAAYGLAWDLLLRISDQLAVRAGTVASTALRDQLAVGMLASPVAAIAFVCRSATFSIFFALVQLTTLVMLHWLTRRRAPAIVLFCLITPFMWALFRRDFSFPTYLVYPLGSILTAYIMLREGILATAVGLLFTNILTYFPLTLDPAAIHFRMSVGMIAFLCAIVAAGAIAAIPDHVSRWLTWWPGDPAQSRSTLSATDAL